MIGLTSSRPSTKGQKGLVCGTISRMFVARRRISLRAAHRKDVLKAHPPRKLSSAHEWSLIERVKPPVRRTRGPPSTCTCRRARGHRGDGLRPLHLGGLRSRDGTIQKDHFLMILRSLIPISATAPVLFCLHTPKCCKVRRFCALSRDKSPSRSPWIAWARPVARSTSYSSLAYALSNWTSIFF